MTLTTSIRRISDTEGRNEGSRFQHNKQRSHHSSVSRENVVSMLGRSGTPRKIFTRTLDIVKLGWKGGTRVKSSWINSDELLSKKYRSRVHTSVVIPKAQTSVAEVGIKSESKCSGAIHGIEPPRGQSTVMLNVDVAKQDKPKSQSRACPSSEIITFGCPTSFKSV